MRKGSSKAGRKSPQGLKPAWLERTETEPPEGLADDIQLWINSPQQSADVRKLPKEFEDLILNTGLERSIAASSSVTMQIRDPSRALFTSGYFSLDGRPDLLLDGLWFRAVEYSKTQADEFTIQFEDREVVIAREYKQPFTFHAHGQPNPRASFIKALLEKAAPHCPLFCPDLLKEQARVKPSKQKKKKKSTWGPHQAAELKRAKQITKSYRLEGSKLDASRARVAEEILDVCYTLNAPPEAQIAILEAAIAETVGGFRTDELGPEGAVGVFQINPAVHPRSVVHAGTRRNAEEWLTKGFAGAGSGISLAQAGKKAGEIAYLVEKPNKGTDFFEQHRSDAEGILKEYHGGNSVKTESTGQRERTTHGSPQTSFKFPKSETKEGEQPEGAWECAVAYAEELKWRLFCRAGRFYLVSDEYLRKNHSVTIEEGDPGVVDMKWSIDLSAKHKNPERLEISARAHLWQCAPGETVRISGLRQGRDIHEGIWIVSDINRPNISDHAVTITLERPAEPLAEAALKPTTVSGAGLGSIPGGPAVPPTPTGGGGLVTNGAGPSPEINERELKRWEKNLAQQYPQTKSRVRWVVARILAEFWGYQNSPRKLVITATTNGNHATNSLHYTGEAYDLAAQNGDQKFMDYVGNWIEAYMKQYLTEGIHNPTLSVHDGIHVNGPVFYGAVWAGHKNHIHIGVREGSTNEALHGGF